MDTRYYTIQMWMVKDLKLKGIERDVFAIIYGFCQDRKSNYHGSIDYLSDMIGHPGRSVMNVLKDLVNKNLLIKKEIIGIGNIYNVNFEVLDNCIGLEVSNEPPEVSSNRTGEVSSGNNKDIYNIDNKEIIESKTLDSHDSIVALGNASSYNKNKAQEEDIDAVLACLNDVTGMKFNLRAKGNRTPVRARLNEKYSLQDFYDVIKYKYDEWGKHPVKFSTGKMSDEYLRPATLFGNKFDQYLQQARRSTSSEGVKIQSIAPSKNKSAKIFI